MGAFRRFAQVDEMPHLCATRSPRRECRSACADREATMEAEEDTAEEAKRKQVLAEMHLSDDDLALLGEIPEGVWRLSVDAAKCVIVDALERARAYAKIEAFKVAFHDTYVPLRQDVFELGDWCLAPSFREALEDGSDVALRSILTDKAHRLYSFDMFTDEFCSALLDEMQNIEKWAKDKGLTIFRPNSMNRCGLILDQCGFDESLQRFMLSKLNQLAALLYPEVGNTLDSHHGFVVAYDMQMDRSLGFHVDDADVTLNVCLGREFKGGDLFFRGIRCPQHQQTLPTAEEDIDVAHVVGRALIHFGRHRHGAHSIQSGERYNLILWCRSSQFRSRMESMDCPPWCGVPESE